jgi:hypothetical protein
VLTTASVSQPQIIFSSEIFPLNFSDLNIMCFQVNPNLETEDAIRLSFYLSRTLPHIFVIWNKPYFYALSLPNYPFSLLVQEWEYILAQVVEEGLTDLSDRTLQIQEVTLTEAIPANVISLLAFQVLKTSQPYPFLPITKLSKNGVQVRREAKFWAEPIEIDGVLQPAITLTTKSKFLLIKNLANFYLNHPDKSNPEKLLLDLSVRGTSRDDIQGNGTISKIIKQPSLEHRQKLIELAKSEVSKQALQDDLSNELLVAVKFGKNKKLYEYGLSALRPCITSETATRFGVDWGELLKETKIYYEERTKLLMTYKDNADDALSTYGFQLGKSINSRHYQNIFWQPGTPIENTSLLFGNGTISTQNRILKGLSQGGVYRRHNKFGDISRPIRITALNLCELNLETFLSQLEKHLKNYKFNSIVSPQTTSLKNLSGTQARAKVEEVVNELINTPPDIVLTFLPQSDRNADDDDGGSLYHKIYDLLLQQQIASQMIYEDTLKNSYNYKNILQQVVPGILAKLGNIPFVLKEPLQIADNFIGLDISRESKTRLSGTMNACASTRLFGKQGEFIRYRLKDGLIQGEEIPKNFLERLLPKNELEGKTVLIYRDGKFCGQEIFNLLEWAEAIGCKLILVECKKSGIPRLYTVAGKFINTPEKGLALRISSSEAVLVTTQVPEKMGLALPLRLTVICGNHSALISPPIEQVVETTLKLTLLHYGALKIPRLPKPVYGSHKIAKLRLRGIYPASKLEGDTEFWL